MRTITQEITLYTYDELSDDAKGRVREWADTFEFEAEWILDDFKTIASMMGFYDITPRYSGFWSQGDGASFTGHYDYAKGAANAVREYAPQDAELARIVDGLQALQKRNFYQLRASLTLGPRPNYYAHENTISIGVERGDAWASDEVQTEFAELARDLMRWLYRALERGYDNCNSDEYLSEHCAANEYEFTADGRIA